MGYRADNVIQRVQSFLRKEDYSRVDRRSDRASASPQNTVPSERTTRHHEVSKTSNNGAKCKYDRLEKISEEDAEGMSGTEAKSKTSKTKVYESIDMTDGKLLGNAGKSLAVKKDSECYV